MAKTKVYYNSACPVCDAGIKGQRERMQACAPQVEWIDIHQHAERLHEIGAEQEFVRERLHVLDAAGRVQIGAEAFRTLFELTPRQRWLARLISLPLVRTAARGAYNAFAAALYQWNRMKKRW